jgi:hypothetical protein
VQKRSDAGMSTARPDLPVFEEPTSESFYTADGTRPLIPELGSIPRCHAGDRGNDIVGAVVADIDQRTDVDRARYADEVLTAQRCTDARGRCHDRGMYGGSLYAATFYKTRSVQSGQRHRMDVGSAPVKWSD